MWALCVKQEVEEHITHTHHQKCFESLGSGVGLFRSRLSTLALIEFGSNAKFIMQATNSSKLMVPPATPLLPPQPSGQEAATTLKVGAYPTSPARCDHHHTTCNKHSRNLRKQEDPLSVLSIPKRVLSRSFKDTFLRRDFKEQFEVRCKNCPAQQGIRVESLCLLAQSVPESALAESSPEERKAQLQQPPSRLAKRPHRLSALHCAWECAPGECPWYPQKSPSRPAVQNFRQTALLCTPKSAPGKCPYNLMEQNPVLS